MSAFPKGDCEDDYIVRAIDKAAKHLGYNNIKELQWKVIKEVLSTYEVHIHKLQLNFPYALTLNFYGSLKFQSYLMQRYTNHRIHGIS